MQATLRKFMLPRQPLVDAIMLIIPYEPSAVSGRLQQTHDHELHHFYKCHAIGVRLMLESSDYWRKRVYIHQGM